MFVAFFKFTNVEDLFDTLFNPIPGRGEAFWPTASMTPKRRYHYFGHVIIFETCDQIFFISSSHGINNIDFPRRFNEQNSFYIHCITVWREIYIPLVVRVYWSPVVNNRQHPSMIPVMLLLVPGGSIWRCTEMLLSHTQPKRKEIKVGL